TQTHWHCGQRLAVQCRQRVVHVRHSLIERGGVALLVVRQGFWVGGGNSLLADASCRNPDSSIKCFDIGRPRQIEIGEADYSRGWDVEGLLARTRRASGGRLHRQDGESDRG